MGTVLAFKKEWDGTRMLFGSMLLEPWWHMIDSGEFVRKLYNESIDGTLLSEDLFLFVCEEEGLEPDTSWDIYNRLKDYEIFRFYEE